MVRRLLELSFLLVAANDVLGVSVVVNREGESLSSKSLMRREKKPAVPTVPGRGGTIAGAPKTTETTCTKKWGKCNDSRCCLDEGFVCYLKRESKSWMYSQCRPRNNCPAGWSCKVLGQDKEEEKGEPNVKGDDNPVKNENEDVGDKGGDRDSQSNSGTNNEGKDSSGAATAGSGASAGGSEDASGAATPDNGASAGSVPTAGSGAIPAGSSSGSGASAGSGATAGSSGGQANGCPIGCEACDNPNSCTQCQQGLATIQKPDGTKQCIELPTMFGGTSHVSASSSASMSMNMYPDLVHSRECTQSSTGDDVCNKCDDVNQCWHGSGAGYLKIATTAGQPDKSFEASVWVTCDGMAQGNWYLLISKLVNGKITAFVQTQHEFFPNRRVGEPITNLGQYGKLLSLNQFIHGDSVIRAIIEPIDPSMETSAEIKIQASHTSPTASRCMGQQHCTSLLAQGSTSQLSEGFKLRNDNIMQLQCLQDTQSVPAEMQSECASFSECLVQHNGKHHLLSLLTAVLNGGSGLLATEKRQPVINHPAFPPLPCFDPATMDVEMLECSCMDDIEQACGSDPSTSIATQAACIKQQICLKSNICESWRTVHCAGDSAGDGNADGLAQISARRSAEGSNASLENHDQALGMNELDNSLAGKCNNR